MPQGSFSRPEVGAISLKTTSAFRPPRSSFSVGGSALLSPVTPVKAGRSLLAAPCPVLLVLPSVNTAQLPPSLPGFPPCMLRGVSLLRPSPKRSHSPPQKNEFCTCHGYCCCQVTEVRSTRGDGEQCLLLSSAMVPGSRSNQHLRPQLFEGHCSPPAGCLLSHTDTTALTAAAMRH